MKAAIIGASSESLYAIEKAAGSGIATIAVDGNPAAPGLVASEEGIVADISDKELILEILKEKQIDFVLPVPIGRFLSTTGYINDSLHLTGVSENAARRCTDKLLFHNELNRRGLRQIDSRPLANLAESDMASFPIPAIMKPRFGSGSKGIEVLRTREDLAKLRLDAVLDSPDILLEELIEGDEYGMDGAVIENRLFVTLLRMKTNTDFPHRQATAYYSVPLSSSLYERAGGYVQEVARALELDACLIHADLIVSGGKVFLIEISARPSGHSLHNNFTIRSSGVDMVQEFINFQKGGKPNFLPQSVAACGIFFFALPDGTVCSVPDETDRRRIDSLVEWNCTLSKGMRVRQAVNGPDLMKRGFFILEASTIEDVQDAAKELLGMIKMV